ncbi:LysR family transcriptional regulator [Aliamphritea hakodatensis]|uniref:LysR family transcriptional regulator n=1 Tax=Aliamphritea hakodatensis TaxID=2895352 RepID=UPI0022FD9251|nr:LysR family transcriptional regulator [Aliamphritea hakodatensis]
MHNDALNTFLTVARCGGFHAAAEQLHITQAAVSARIRSLENQLDVSLFERGPGGSQLSEAGKYLLPYAEQMQTTWQQVSRDLKERFTDHIALRLGAQMSIWEQRLIDWVIWIETEHGKLPMTLDFDYHRDMNQAVQNRLVDVAISHRPGKESNLISYPLPSERLILLARRACHFNDPDLPRFIDFDFGEDYHREVNAALPDSQRLHVFSGNSAMGLRYIMANGGMSYYPLRLAQQYLESKQLHPVENAPDIALPCYLTYHRDNPHKGLIEEMIQAYFNPPH